MNVYAYQVCSLRERNRHAEFPVFELCELDDDGEEAGGNEIQRPDRPNGMGLDMQV